MQGSGNDTIIDARYDLDHPYLSSLGSRGVALRRRLTWGCQNKRIHDESIKDDSPRGITSSNPCSQPPHSHSQSTRCSPSVHVSPTIVAPHTHFSSYNCRSPLSPSTLPALLAAATTPAPPAPTGMHISPHIIPRTNEPKFSLLANAPASPASASAKYAPTKSACIVRGRFRFVNHDDLYLKRISAFLRAM